jgi:F0F1-type ATP synthase assembly protein I
MAFQMMAIILAGTFGGLKLDQWLSAKPVFTVILSILSIIFAIYFMVRDLLHRK